ncbi:MAG: hypothetical protein Q9227_007177 [Pyrenula ochraceoflavens]
MTVVFPGGSNASGGQQTDAEEAAQVLEHFVEGTARTNGDLFASSGPVSSKVAPDFPNMHWCDVNDPRKQGEALALIQEVVDAMPELDIIRLLFEVFVIRCQGPLRNVIHTQSFMRRAEEFCSCLFMDSREARATALHSTVSIDTLACFLMAVRMPIYSA